MNQKKTKAQWQKKKRPAWRIHFDHIGVTFNGVFTKAWQIKEAKQPYFPIIAVPENIGGRLDKNGRNIWTKEIAHFLAAAPDVANAAELALDALCGTVECLDPESSEFAASKRAIRRLKAALKKAQAGVTPAAKGGAK